MTDNRLKNLCAGLRDAALTAAFLEGAIRRSAASAMAAFWHDCFPVLCQMVNDLVPQVMAVESRLSSHPSLRGLEDEILRAAVAAKSENPAGSFEENLERALSRVKEGAHGKEG